MTRKLHIELCIPGRYLKRRMTWGRVSIMSGMETSKRTLTLQHGSTQLCIPVCPGESFRSVHRSLPIYIRGLSKPYALFTSHTQVDLDSVIHTHQLGLTFEVRELALIDVQLPFGRPVQVTLKRTDNMQNLADFVSKAINFPVHSLLIFHQNRLLALSDSLCTPVNVEIFAHIPTIYLVEHSQIRYHFTKFPNITFFSLLNYINWLTGRREERLVLIHEGKKVESIPDKDQLFLFMKYVKEDLTVVVRCAGQSYGLDVSGHDTLQALYEKIAAKIGKNEEGLRVIYRGKWHRKEGYVRDMGLTQGCLLHVLSDYHTCPVVIRTPQSQVTMDIPPSQTISQLTTLLSQKVNMHKEKIGLVYEQRLLQGEEGIPEMCRKGQAQLHMQVLSLIYIRRLSGKVTRVGVGTGKRVSEVVRELCDRGVLTRRDCEIKRNGKVIPHKTVLKLEVSGDKLVFDADDL